MSNPAACMRTWISTNGRSNFRPSPSELVADCFALAREIRELDMRASPYDFQALGIMPVCIETPQGRAEYETSQRDFARRAIPLRQRLIALCQAILQP